MRPVADIKAADGNAAQFKQPQPETIPTGPHIAFHQAVPFENRGQAMHRALVKFYLLRELSQAGIVARIGKRIDDRQRTVQDLYFVRRRIRLTIRHRRAQYGERSDAVKGGMKEVGTKSTKNTKLPWIFCAFCGY